MMMKNDGKKDGANEKRNTKLKEKNPIDDDDNNTTHTVCGIFEKSSGSFFLCLHSCASNIRLCSTFINDVMRFFFFLLLD